MTPRPAFAGALPQQMRVSSCTDSTLQSSPDGHLDYCLPLTVCTADGADSEEAQMDIRRSGSQPSKKGPEDYFTGTVRVDAPFSGSGNLSGATVTFEPG